MKIIYPASSIQNIGITSSAEPGEFTLWCIDGTYGFHDLVKGDKAPTICCDASPSCRVPQLYSSFGKSFHETGFIAYRPGVLIFKTVEFVNDNSKSHRRVTILWEINPEMFNLSFDAVTRFLLANSNVNPDEA